MNGNPMITNKKRNKGWGGFEYCHEPLKIKGRNSNTRGAKATTENSTKFILYLAK